MPVEIICSSVEDALPRLAAESFDGVLCDPPYGLSFMGKAWDHGVPGSPIWREVGRALRPGGHVLAFGGTRTFHRLTCAIEDAGFEIRDCAAWLYGSGFPKSRNVSAALGGSSAWDGYGTALKPAWEPCIVAMKPLDGTFAENALTHGVAGLAIDASRIAVEGGSPAATRRASSTVPSDNAARRESGGAPLVDRTTPERFRAARPGEAVGRWPANVVLDEEAGAMLDAQSPARGPDRRGHGGGTRPSGFGDVGSSGGDGKPCGALYADSGGASRFFYCAKVGRAERSGSTHPTMKPVALNEYLARMLLPPPRAGGAARRLLVPFAGAGSEMLGALAAGWDEVVGIEREAEYVADARRRIADRFGVLHPIREAVA